MTFLLLGVFATSIFARTMSKVEYVCPIDGKKFEALTEMSGYQSGMQLDLKPLGAIGAPGHIAQCPGNNFVLYKPEAEYSKADIENLKKYILTENYQKLSKSNTKYFLAAKTMQYMKEDKLAIAHFFLMATWEVDEEKTKYQRYAEHALKVFQEYLQDSPEEDEEWVSANILVSELYRRLGKFDEAMKFYEKLASHQKFSQGDFISHLIHTELELVKNKDIGAHDIPEQQ